MAHFGQGFAQGEPEVLGIYGDGTTYVALTAKGAAIDHLRKFLQHLLVQFLGTKDSCPEPVLAADKGLEDLDFSPGINILFTPLSVYGTVIEAFTTAGAGIDFDQLFGRKV
jgi:hypothetical protein